MSSSPELPSPPAGRALEVAVSAGTSLWGVKREPLPSPPSRGAEELHGVGDDVDRLALAGPSLASHSRHSRRPSIATGRPFTRYLAQFSPCAPQTVTSK